MDPQPWLSVEDIWGAFGDDAEVACRAFAEYCEIEDTTTGLMPTPPLMFGSPEAHARLSEVLAPTRCHREFIYPERFADRPSLLDLFADAHNAARRDEAARRAFDDHGYTLGEIGALLGVAPATVWRHVRGLTAGWRARGTETNGDASERIEI